MQLSSLSPERFRSVAGEHFAAIEPEIAEAREQLEGRVVWHLNSTARGGGVAEILRSYLAYARGAGVDARWLVIGGDARFFEVTKRIHNHLHGSPGDGGPLGSAETEAYAATLKPAGDELANSVRAGVGLPARLRRRCRRPRLLAEGIRLGRARGQPHLDHAADDRCLLPEEPGSARRDGRGDSGDDRAVG